MDALTRLFNTYSLSDIIIILVLVSAAVMGGGRFIEGTYDRLKKFFSRENRTQNREAALDDHLAKIDEQLKQSRKADDQITKTIESLASTLAILVESDKDNTKAYLTDKHHYFVFTHKWIDDFNLECIERRYLHYKKFGGNSFIDHFMEELRALPNRPPGDNKDDEKEGYYGTGS